jgi:hypothetical protein
MRALAFTMHPRQFNRRFNNFGLNLYLLWPTGGVRT